MGPWIKTFGSVLLMLLASIVFGLVTGDRATFSDVVAGVAIYALFRTYEQEPRP